MVIRISGILTAILFSQLLLAQHIEVDGKVKIVEMDTLINQSRTVVRDTDGTLAVRLYQVGDIAHGGIIFWVDATGEHGLVCAQDDLVADGNDFLHQWSPTHEFTGATGDGVYAGWFNTLLNVSAQPDISAQPGQGQAARVAADLVEGGYGDWYLPSKIELNLMYSNLKQAGLGAFTNEFYWSSTEENLSQAWRQNFNDGGQSTTIKIDSYRSRAIRMF